MKFYNKRHEMYLNSIQEFSLYLTQNTLYIHYKYEPVSVVQENTHCLRTMLNILHFSGKKIEFFNVGAGGTYTNH
jgi:hypothetical protein